MPALTLQPTVVSEVGRRENNEDAAFASPRLLAVADGVGGAAAGEVASNLVILKMIGLDKSRLVDPLETALGAAVADGNALVAFAMLCEARLRGMGTTLTAVALSNDGNYLIANVGDSRTYLLREGALLRLTRDDSLIQELLDRGLVSEDQARSHPQRSVVLEALDGLERSFAAPRSVPACPGDRLLLCSDGLSDYVPEGELARLLATDDPNIAARELVTAALDRGSRDNVTVVIADVAAQLHPEDGWLDALPAVSASSS